MDRTQQELIAGFYTRFDSIQQRYSIQQDHIWNMDEHGIALGVCTNSQVLAASYKKRTLIKSPETREWVSILETISAAGKFTRPLVIFKGKNLQTTWFEETSPD
jgi:hypothetical protein